MNKKYRFIYNKFKPYIPLCIGIILLSTIAFKITLISYYENDKHFIYTLDDPYIHMAIAKNIVTEGVFGVTPYKFSSSSSSPLWTLLLAGVYFVFGKSEITPLILNYIFALFCIIFIFYLCQKYSLSILTVLLIEIFFIFLTPLIPIIFTGMEHTLHILTILMVTFYFLQTLSKFKKTSIEIYYFLFLSSFLAVAIRYESLFLIIFMIIILLLSKKYYVSLGVFLSSVIPVFTFGIISIMQDAYFLPNSLMIKGSLPNLNSLRGIIDILGYSAHFKLSMGVGHLFIIIIAGLIVYLFKFKKCSYNEPRQFLLISLFLTTLLHLEFAKTNWFYRYEAYIVSLGIVLIGISLDYPLKLRSLFNPNPKNCYKIFAILALVSLFLRPLFSRGKDALRKIVPATKNIYEQQYQMGTFLNKYYTKSSVAANDIGAINFLSNIRCLDLWGIGSIEITKAKRSNQYNTKIISKLCSEENVEIAIVYNDWFKGEISLPTNWIDVGHWTISNNIVCGGRTVNFFATTRKAVPYLKKALNEFSKELPLTVIEGGSYKNEMKSIERDTAM